jgi:hypothetical protein
MSTKTNNGSQEISWCVIVMKQNLLVSFLHQTSHNTPRKVEFRDFLKFPRKSALVVVKKYSNMHYYNVLAETPQSLSIYYFPG